jgi:heme exporter protein A
MTARPDIAHLAAIELACRRGDRLLFAGLSFALQPGEAMQVVGANGTGKSSLIRILAGLLPAYGGRVEYDGTLALVDDRLPLDDHLPLGKALAVWNAIDGGVYSRGAIAAVGLAELVEVPVGFLSTGQRKRAALLLALARGGGLWLLDEPLNGLDTAGAEMMAEALRAFRGGGGMAVIASHQQLTIPDLRTIDLADFAT